MDYILYIGTAFGLIFVIEGLLYALFPDAMRRMLAQIIVMQTPQLKSTGIITALIGVNIVYLVNLLS
ncbi:MAG: DUF2065 domain-containing protein [Bdellovibrionales bacterium]